MVDGRRCAHLCHCPGLGSSFLHLGEECSFLHQGEESSAWRSKHCGGTVMFASDSESQEREGNIVTITCRERTIIGPTWTGTPPFAATSKHSTVLCIHCRKQFGQLSTKHLDQISSHLGEGGLKIDRLGRSRFDQHKELDNHHPQIHACCCPRREQGKSTPLKNYTHKRNCTHEHLTMTMYTYPPINELD